MIKSIIFLHNLHASHFFTVYAVQAKKAAPANREFIHVSRKETAIIPVHRARKRRQAIHEVIAMSHTNAGNPIDQSLRINPEKRLVPLFDSVGIALFPVAEQEKMGMRVLSNFCEEHIM